LQLVLTVKWVSDIETVSLGEVGTVVVVMSVLGGRREDQVRGGIYIEGENTSPLRHTP
jgi:hypothetical protein